MTVEGLTLWIKGLDGEVACVKKIPAVQASFGGFGKLDKMLISALTERGIHNLYSHQSEAIELTLDGRDVVIATPTASGKTLCYNLPVVNSILKENTCRALYLFPTKALAQDQLAELDEMSRCTSCHIGAFTYDGDTPAGRRNDIRQCAHVIITNPDMLSTGILPHHDKWISFFKNLRYIVVDELHAYRGIFGSHMANLFTRLSRVCGFYGSHPQFICCSATIANPKEHAAALTGREVCLVRESGAPTPERDFILYNPRVINAKTGMRRSSLFETSRIASEALCNGISTIVFTRSRVNVELLLKLIRGKLSEQGKDPGLVTGYRAGYMPNERRRIEKGLRAGKLLGVVSTNALELGVDIGALDLAVLHGYPGSIASAWQQIGRAGRRRASAAVMVASALPLDQFLAARPEWFFGSPHELAYIDPSNPYVRVAHVKASAFELAFRPGEKFGSDDISEILEYYTERGLLRLSSYAGYTEYQWAGHSYPAASLSLRSARVGSYTITDISEPLKPRVIGSMDIHSAHAFIYPDAIYLHDGVSYVVEELDTVKRLCMVRRVATDYYTEGDSSSRVSVAEVFESCGHYGWGKVLIANTPSMYRKIKLSTHENVGHGPINLPEDTISTTAFWITIPSSLSNGHWLLHEMEGMANLLRNTIPFFLMCDKGDIEVHSRLKDPYLLRPVIFIADNIPGGVGIAEGTYRLGDSLIAVCRDALDFCSCENGCPACIGAQKSGNGAKELVKGLISSLLSH